MAGLTQASLGHKGSLGDIEWWMHYVVAFDQLHEYYEHQCEVKKSLVKPSTLFPSASTGDGLFTETALKKGDFIIGFPGYWMHTLAFGKHQHNSKGNYAFSTPKGNSGWGQLEEMLYVTHECQANKINAGEVNGEVLTHTVYFSLHSYLPQQTPTHKQPHAGLGTPKCALRVRSRPSS